MAEPRDAAGVCALVTGASRGIGAATARALADAGHAVGINYRQDAERAQALAEEIIAGGGRALAVQADVTDSGQLEGAFARLEEHFGRVLILVNNAGLLDDGLVTNMEDEAWARVQDTNLTAVFRTVRRATPGMLRARWGRIVNVASVGGLHGNAGQGNYAAAKAGVLGFTRVVAAEVGRRGITANAIAPGLIDTEMVADVPRDLLAHVPARRAGTPEEVAAAVCFLASPQASYVNGSTLVVDGGMTA